MVGRKKPKQVSFDTPVVATPATRARDLLRTINELADFEFVREMVQPYFADTGRPSVDPVLMLKMMLVGYLFDINSDRRLVDECADRLSFREFLGYMIDEPMPVHATFTHWRQRLGAEFFRQVLHEIVRQCQDQGMTLSGARCVDGTRIKAQASRGGPKVEVPKDGDMDQYLDDCFAGDIPVEEPPEPPPDTETFPVNLHDPDARLQGRKGERAEFIYVGSFCSDPGSGLIMDATAHPREHASTALEHIWRELGLVDEFAGDKLYNHAETLALLQHLGVTCHVPKPAAPTGAGVLRDKFTYDPDRNVHICPMGNVLKWSRYHEQRCADFYTAKISDCRDCPLKSECTTADRRSVSRLRLQYARDATVRAGPRYKYLQVRRTISEHLNLLGKRDHCLSRARGLGLSAVRIQVALVAVAINLKKLVRHASSPPADAFPCVVRASLTPALAWHLCFALQSALSGLIRALGAIPTAAGAMRIILPERPVGPQPAVNQGF